MKKFVLFLMAASVLLIPVTGCYAKGPWRGKVIDAETKQPIEGAAVVAVWNWELRGPAGGETRFLDAEETATNKDGVFEIPSKSFLSIPLVRKVNGPYFTIYKPGYGTFPKQQISPQYLPDELFEVKGAIVELPKLTTKEKRLSALDNADLGDIIVPRKKIPYLKRLINEERKRFGLEIYK